MRQALLLAALLVALSGCALQPRTRTEPASPTQLAAWEQRSASLGLLDRFDLGGRVASGAIGFKADLRWSQSADGQFRLRLSGPFGARAAELAGDDHQVRVRTGTDAPELVTDPETWLEQALGCRIPVSGLRWWARGLPAPGIQNAIELDGAGRASRIVQSGWDLSYVTYQAVDGLDLPRRIEARNGDTRVLLLVDRWSGLAAAPTPSAS
jgi:outer membrane lipoprotein LolB